MFTAHGMQMSWQYSPSYGQDVRVIGKCNVVVGKSVAVSDSDEINTECSSCSQMVIELRWKM
jgi:hypothetical protein